MNSMFSTKSGGVLALIFALVASAGTACAQRSRPESKPAEPPKPDAHRPPTKGWDEVTEVYSGRQFLNWPAGEVDGKGARVSPTLEFATGFELNHHRVKVTYTGAGSVELSVAHHTDDKFDLAVASSAHHSRFQPLAGGKEVMVSSPYKAERCCWLILRTSGDVQVTEIRHTCWRGKGTVFGHSPGAFPFAGAKLNYRLMYPRNYDPSKSYPLVLSVHGSGGVGNDNERSMEMVIFARYLFTQYYGDDNLACFSLVTQIPLDADIPKPYWPQGPKGAAVTTYHPDWPAVNEDGWYAQATLALIRALLDGKQISIDPERVYFTGFSFGGKACWEFLKADRTLFAAAMAGSGWPIGGAYQNPERRLLDRLDLEVQRYKHVPVSIFAGGQDAMRFGAKAVHDAMLAAGGKSRYVEFPETDHTGTAGKIWGDRKYVAWLFEQNRRNNPKPGDDPYPDGVYPEWRPRLQP